MSTTRDWVNAKVRRRIKRLRPQNTKPDDNYSSDHRLKSFLDADFGTVGGHFANAVTQEDVVAAHGAVLLKLITSNDDKQKLRADRKSVV